MRGKTKLISLAAMLSVFLVASMVFANGVINVSKMSLFSSTPVEPDSPGTAVFVNPDTIIVDYFDPDGYQIGDTLTIHVNVTTDVVPGIFSYQVNLTWNTAVLNYTGISSYGDFLAKTGSIYGTSRGEKIDSASNDTGYAAVAETILGEYAGITDTGRLFTVTFEVIGYGCSNIVIGTGGELPTKFLDSTGAEMTYSTGDGYFKNKLDGDSNGDKIVNVLDRGVLSSSWTGVPGALPYSRDVDNNDDGIINVLDRGITSTNWGRSVP